MHVTHSEFHYALQTHISLYSCGTHAGSFPLCLSGPRIGRTSASYSKPSGSSLAAQVPDTDGVSLKVRILTQATKWDT